MRYLILFDFELFFEKLLGNSVEFYLKKKIKKRPHIKVPSRISNPSLKGLLETFSIVYP